MAQCNGALVVHCDASAAACTEELEGRCCPGPDAEHAAPTVTCEDFLGHGGCEVCAMEAFTDRDWRHAAHVAAMAGRAGRCTSHRRTGRRQPVVGSEELLFRQLTQLLRAG